MTRTLISVATLTVVALALLAGGCDTKPGKNSTPGKAGSGEPVQTNKGPEAPPIGPPSK